MLSLIVPALVLALVAITGLATALKARSRVLATAGALTSTAVFAWLTVVGWEFGPFAWSLGACTAFNLLLAVAVAVDRRPASTGAARRVRDRYPDAVQHRDGLTGRTFTVERVTVDTPRVEDGSFAVGRLAVVDRRDGAFEALWRIALTGEDPEETEQAAAVCARRLRCHGLSARYVRRGLDPDSSMAVRSELAVDTILGGAR